MTTLLFDKTQLEQMEITAGLLALQEDFPFAAKFEGEADIAVTMVDAAGDKLSLHLADGKAVFTFDFTKTNEFIRFALSHGMK